MMKKYLLTIFTCAITFTFYAQEKEFLITTTKATPPPPLAILEGCEDTEDSYECGQEKALSAAFDALKETDIENVLNATELDIIFMNVHIEFDKDKKIATEQSSVVFHESEMRPMNVSLSFSAEDLPLLIHNDKEVALTVFRKHLFLKLDRVEKKLIPLPDYEPERVPFSGPEVGIVYPGCEKASSNEERKKCMATHISKFVGENFNNKLGKKLGLDGINRIYVVFKINEEGKVKDIRSRAPHPQLEQEAIRIIKKLPVMQPATIENIPVSVNYSLPIVFNVSAKERKKRKRNKW